MLLLPSMSNYRATNQSVLSNLVGATPPVVRQVSNWEVVDVNSACTIVKRGWWRRDGDCANNFKRNCWRMDVLSTCLTSQSHQLPGSLLNTFNIVSHFYVSSVSGLWFTEKVA